MCRLCDEGNPQTHSSSRRDFLKASAATGVAVTGASLFAARPAPAHDSDVPEDTGRRGRRYVIRGGAVMSMDPAVGDFPQADVLVEGKKIVAVGPNLKAGGATVIDARGRIVMPASSTRTITCSRRRCAAISPTGSCCPARRAARSTTSSTFC
ncbi:MAG: twin-arginine translocation signal domain-containing protein [Candidatus Rokuibacteriota bacterium]